MLVVTLQRQKCIGCNYCVEMAPAHFAMSKKDGKTVMLHSQDNKGFHTFKTKEHALEEIFEAAAKACPVHIISCKTT